MNSKIQQFIENNIHLINNEMYYNLFTVWYEFIGRDDGTLSDGVSLLELFHIFGDAGINLEKDSLNARMKIIKNKLIESIDNKVTKKGDVVSITIFSDLRSRLGLRLDDILRLFHEACEEKGLVPCNNTRSRYQLQ